MDHTEVSLWISARTATSRRDDDAVSVRSHEIAFWHVAADTRFGDSNRTSHRRPPRKF